MRCIVFWGALALGAAGVAISAGQAQESRPPPNGGLLQSGSHAPNQVSNTGVGAVTSTPAQIRDGIGGPTVRAPSSTVTMPADATPTPTVNTPTVNTPTVNIQTPKVNVTTPTVKIPTVNIPTPTVNVPTPRVNTPTVNVPTPTVATPGVATPQPNDPATARSQQAVAQLSPQCRGQLNDLFQGADSGDQDKASKAYDSLRAQCDGQVRALAGAAGMALPERIMTARSQRLMGRAMSGDVGQVPSTAEAAAQNGGSFDTGEVLQFSLTLLNVLSGVAGVYAAMPGGAAARFGSNMGSIGNRPVRSTYGQGAPAYRPAPPSHQSDITGTGR